MINSILNILNEHKKFYIAYSIFFVLSLLLLLNYSSAEITLWFNNNHTIFFNYFFRFFSFIGEGPLFGIAILIAAIFRIKYLINGLIFYLAPNIITYILKVSLNYPRPLEYFVPGILNKIEGVELYKNYSFPSGHTTSGFAIFMFLLFITKNKKYSYLYLTSAIMIGISRVYLLQHFYIDIYVASFISVSISTFIYYYLNQKNMFLNKRWYNYSLINKIKSKNVSRETN